MGAGLGVLFAPKKGKETRQDIKDWLDERREQGSEILAKLKEQIPQKKEAVTAAIRAGKEAYQEAARTNSEKHHAVRS